MSSSHHTPSPEPREGAADVNELLKYCKMIFLNSLSPNEKSQLQRLEQKLLYLNQETEVIQRELNQKRNKNHREMLNEIILKYKSRLLSEVVRMNINQLINQKDSFLGGNAFLQYLDEERFDMSVPWDSLQVSYSELIQDYISDQQNSMTVEPLKIKLTKQFLHEFIMEFLEKQMSQQAFKSKNESSSKSEKDISRKSNLDFLSSEVLTILAADKKSDSDEAKKSLEEFFNKPSKDKLGKKDKKTIMEFINLLDKDYRTYAEFENKLKEFKANLNPQETNFYIFLPEFDENKSPYQKHFKTLLTLEKSTSLSVRQHIVSVINSLKEFIGNRRSSEENRFVSMIQQFNFLSEKDKKYIIELANLISNAGHDKEKKEIEEKDILLSKLIKLNDVPNKQELLDELKKLIEYHSDLPLRVHKEVLAELSQRFGIEEEIALANAQAEIQRLQNLSGMEQNREMAYVDKMLFDILRAQVLHAAKIYFVEVKMDEGFFHKIHHKDEKKEREAVADLIRPLLSEGNHSFIESLQLVHKILEKRPGGLHQNSFATILLAVLYNEGEPKGIFRINLYNEGEPKGIFRINEKNAAKFVKPELSYKGYPPTANASQDPIGYLKNLYFPPNNTKIKGKLVNNLRGKKALLDANSGRLSPENKVPILEKAQANLLEFEKKFKSIYDQRIGPVSHAPSFKK